MTLRHPVHILPQYPAAKMRRYCLRTGIALLLAGCGTLYAHALARDMHKRATVTFGINSAEIDLDFDDNRSVMAGIREFVDKAATGSDTVITDICISGYASPDGPAEVNTRLAEARMHALSRAISWGGG